ncbi:hypothetical protein Taro_001434 [Colocasia esculenta]|uniref:SAC domain-containing protein n=1 Tax=Colocasia esculenta TaxID=4460 RepID=A0A843TG49_COLES|nr:hypothetical protein [Colocasia esculenta]
MTAAPADEGELAAARIVHEGSGGGDAASCYLQKFRLYETRSLQLLRVFLLGSVTQRDRIAFLAASTALAYLAAALLQKFYMIGRDKRKTLWKVLKIDRLEPCELNIREDSTTYSASECRDLLKRIHEGNRSTGGLKFVTNCYGIVGFIKFLGPYYMLLITKRRQIGAICGHTVYAITKSEMIALPNSTVQTDMANSKNENRSFVHSTV